MELTAVQRQTMVDLLEVRDDLQYPPDLATRLKARIEAAADGARFDPPLRLWKERLAEHGRCEGLFDALMKEEAPPVPMSEAMAAGVLSHRTIELDVVSEVAADADDVASAAADRLGRDRRFGELWGRLDEFGRGELRMQAVRSLEQFRASFPPVRALRRVLAPVTELWLESAFGGGSVRLKGKVDLLLNASRGGRSTRILIDLKGGRSRPEHVEDMRLYALLFTLRTGVPPYRVATFFLSSGTWQPEDVTLDVLEHAADRVAAAIRSARHLTTGAPPELRAGPHCLRCPRADCCPAAWKGGDAAGSI